MENEKLAREGENRAEKNEKHCVCVCVFKAKVIRGFQQEKRLTVSNVVRDQALSEVTRSLDRRELLTLLNYQDQMWGFLYHPCLESQKGLFPYRT